MAKRTTDCASCGTTFVAPESRGRLPKYCSNRCRRDNKPRCEEDGCDQSRLARGWCSTHYNRWHRATQGPNKPYYYDKTCEVCGRTFRTGRPDTRTCGIRGNYDCRWFIEENPRSEAVDYADCEACGDTFVARHRTVYCSPSCAEDPLPWVMGWCPECDTPHVSRRQNSIYCSAICRTRAMRHTPASRKARAEAKRRRRAVKHGADAERFNVTEIHERDNWTCQICGLKTRPDWNYLHPLAPTIDHIIPLSKGGHHTKKNCQTAHRRCNSEKSDGVPLGGDQLRLVG